MRFLSFRACALSSVLITALVPACGGSTFEAAGDAGKGSRAAGNGGGAASGGANSGGATASSGGANSGGATAGSGGSNSGGTTSSSGGSTSSSGGSTSSGGKGSGGATNSGGSNAGGVAQGGSGGSAHGGGGTTGSGGTGGDGPCKTDADCSENGICGFPTKDGCSATGTCFPAPGATCAAYSPGCACDGTITNLACNGLPSGYSVKPLAYVGNCTTNPTTFACGSALKCHAGAEYCNVSEGGACCSPPSYSCVALPSPCAAKATCACVKPIVSPTSCTESNGGVTVTFAYP